MRILISSRIFILFLSVGFVACQESAPPPTPTATPAPTSMAIPAATETPQKPSPSPFEGSVEVDLEEIPLLFNGRKLLITYMSEVDGISVPPVDAWTLRAVDSGDEFRTYLFESGEWMMRLMAPQIATGNLQYRARVTGPDDLVYQADILLDGSIAVAQ